MSEDIVAVIVNMNDNGDLVYEKYQSIDEAKKALAEMEWKAYLITGEIHKIEDHT